MKFLFSTLMLLAFLQTEAQNKQGFISFGLDYRIFPIDIEDVPNGPLPADMGLPEDDSKFWQATSVHTRYGIHLKRNWSLSMSFYTRYNLLHRLEGINVDKPYPENIRKKKTFKYDVFIDLEKKIRLRKFDQSFFILAGAGFTNMNSRYDITLTDYRDSGPFLPRRYKGTFLRFTPRLSLGYQYQKMRGSLDTYFIEGSTRNNLTALWFGGTISYELQRRKKNKPTHSDQTRPGF